MIYLTFAGAFTGKNGDGWSWGDPVGLGIFMVAVALTLGLLAWTIKTLSSIEDKSARKK